MDQEMEGIKAKQKVEANLDVVSWCQENHYWYYGEEDTDKDKVSFAIIYFWQMIMSLFACICVLT